MSPLSYSVKRLKKQNRNKFAFKLSILYLDQHNKKQGKQIIDEDVSWILLGCEFTNFCLWKGKDKEHCKISRLKIQVNHFYISYEPIITPI